jgi:hypothetical protein
LKHVEHIGWLISKFEPIEVIPAKTYRTYLKTELNELAKIVQVYAHIILELIRWLISRLEHIEAIFIYPKHIKHC